MKEYYFLSQFQDPTSVSLKRRFYFILCMFNRRNELYRLVSWAKRRRHKRALQWYLKLVEADERRIIRYSVDYPHLTRFAYRVHQLNCFLFPPPKYFSMGAAKGYRARPSA